MKAEERYADEFENAISDLPKNERSRAAKRTARALDYNPEVEINDTWNSEIRRRVDAMNDGTTGVCHEEATQRARTAVAKARS